MTSPIVDVRNLVKWYGPRLAVRDVSFSIAPGEVVGILGPNGSGKSTIFRILTGYLAPTSGTAMVAGLDASSGSLALRRHIGYVPEDAPLYDHMRVGEFLGFMARLKGVTGRAVGGSVERVAKRLQLGSVLSTPVSKLSRGYRQRVAMAQALLGDPTLLILDEPTSGLDPSQVIAVRDLIRELAGEKTILIASHVLSEIERIASRVIILLDGVLLTTDALKRDAALQRLEVDVTAAAPEAEVRACLGAVPGVRSVAVEEIPEEATLRYWVDAERRSLLAQDIAAALAGRGLALSGLAERPPDLEETFLALTRHRGKAAA
jgi:ABC-2 type transport system ATP-binding protein